MDENGAITGATKTKVTYDAKGLVTSGADATQDDIGDGTTYKQYSATDKTKLAGIETAADVTDATNVDAAGATMNADTTLAGNGYFLDEDNMASNSATKAASQQSIKAYIDAQVASGGGTVDTVVAGTNIDVDATDPANPIVSVETLTIADISGITASATEINYTDNVTSAIQTQLDGKQPLDSDLTTIAGLTATTDNFMQAKSSAWASRTVAQVAADLKVELGKLLYPIGYIIEFGVSTNPSDASMLGFGTWAAYGTGRVTVAIDVGQTEFDTLDETGGSKTHTLITGEIPSHQHVENFASGGGGSNGIAGTGGLNTGNSASAQSTATTGGGGAHNNLQPYIVLYRWKRTA